MNPIDVMKIFRLLLPILAITAHLHGAIEINGIAATVNGKVVTKNEVNFMAAPIKAQLQARYPRRNPAYYNELNKARTKILDELINREIMMHVFEEGKGSIPESAVDSEIRRQIRNLYNGSENKFRKELAKSGLSQHKYRELTKRKLIVGAMRAQQFSDSAPPTPSEINAEYAKHKHKLRNITKDSCDYQKIYIPKLDPDNLDTTPENQLELAEDITKKLKNGADFAELAKAHSSGAFADDGGYWEDVQRVDLSPEFGSIIFDAKTKSIIGPLEDTRGFTIVKTLTKRYGPSPPISKVRTQIEARVKSRKSSARFERWIKGQRSKAMINRKM